MMGCSNPHPHGQVRELVCEVSCSTLNRYFSQAWCTSYIPTIPSTILESQRAYAHSTSNVGASLESVLLAATRVIRVR